MAISTIQVTFDADNNEFDIVTTSGNAAGTNWFFGIEGPAGTIKVLDTGTPDGTGTGVSVSIPDIVATMLDGDYTFEVRMEDPGGSTENQKTTFTLAQTGVISYQITHTPQTITFKDVTSYPSQTGSPAYSRTSIITKPIPAAGVNAAQLAFTTSQVTLSMALGDGAIYENVNWGISGAGSGQFTETSAFTIGYNGTWEFIYDRDYTGGANHFVIITTDPCGFINCLDEVWQGLVADATRKGGLRAVEPYKAEQLALLLGHAALYNYWRDCGDIAQAQYYYEQLASLGECEITTTPRVVTGQATPGVWTNIPPASYLNGYTENVGSPFQYLVAGGLIFFRGVVNSANEDTAGLDLISPAYWTSVGITFYEENWFMCVDASGAANKVDLYYAKTEGGTIRIYSYGSNSVTRPFALVGPLPIV